MNYKVSKLSEKYIEYFANIKTTVTKPKMPKYNEFAYTDNEYKACILELQSALDLQDDLELTEKFLKGD